MLIIADVILKSGGDVKGGDMTLVMNGRGNDALYTLSTILVTTAITQDFWSQMYYGVLQANNLLEGIQNGGKRTQRRVRYL